MLDNSLLGSNSIIFDTFDLNSHVFTLVQESNNYFLKYEVDNRLIRKIVIKPNFWIFFNEGGYEECSNFLKPIPYYLKKLLTKNVYIDPSIFNILMEYDLISYSKAMADLYDLPELLSRDIQYHINDYKRRKSKQLVLEKMKNGIFD